jgi:TPR repeat protein
MYYSGKLGPEQLENAFYWLHQAAENDNAPAQWMIGIMRFNGQGVSPDSIAAYSWLSLASEQRHPQASLKLSQLKSELSAQQLSLANSLTTAFKQQHNVNTVITPQPILN